MASGTITLSSTSAMRGQIVWESEPDISTNSSVVNAWLQVRKSSSLAETKGTFTGWVKVAGEKISGEYYGEVGGEWENVAEITYRVSHDGTGNAQIYIEGSVKGPSGTTLSGHTCSGGETVALDTIPVSVSLTDASNFNDEENPSISYSNPGGNNADSLTAYLLSGDGNTTFAERTLNKTGSSYNFDLTDTEREALRNATPNSNKMSVLYRIVGVFGTTQMTAELTKEFSIVNANPAVTPSLTIVNPQTDVTGSADKLIRFISNVDASMSAVALKGAALTDQTITCGSKTISAASGTFLGVESGEFVFTAEDSRGNRTSVTLTREIVAYILPTISIDSNAPETDGDFVLSVRGNFFNANFGTLDNTLSVQYRYKVANGDFGDWQTMTPVVDGNGYTAQQIFTGLDYQTTYTFQARVTDRLRTVETPEKPIRTLPVFNWGKDYFNVNGQFMVDGKPFCPYNVGDIYITTNSTNPAEIWGGEWEKLEGRFLLAADSTYQAGSTGGANTHTLTLKELAPHNHKLNAGSVSRDIRSDAVTSGRDSGVWPIPYSSASTNNALVTDAGGGEPFSIMPPYLAVHMWKRTA